VIPLVVKPIGGAEYRTLDISSISVTDGKGNRVPAKYDAGGNSVTLTIGDPSVLVTGKSFYVVRYTLWGLTTANLVSDQADFDVTGGGWDAPIMNMRAEFVFPRTVDPKEIRSSCARVDEFKRVSPCGADAILIATSTEGNMTRFLATSTGPHTSFVVQSIFPKGAILYKDARKAVTLARGTGVGAIVKWWERPFLDIFIAFPFGLFFLLLGMHLERGRRDMVKYRKSYLLSGVALVALSFFLYDHNLAALLSGLVLLSYAAFLSLRKG
jgi:hypothetical protein